MQAECEEMLSLAHDELNWLCLSESPTRFSQALKHSAPSPALRAYPDVSSEAEFPAEFSFIVKNWEYPILLLWSGCVVQSFMVALQNATMYHEGGHLWLIFGDMIMLQVKIQDSELYIQHNSM
jgi:hypothetical protein